LELVSIRYQHKNLIKRVSDLEIKKHTYQNIDNKQAILVQIT